MIRNVVIHVSNEQPLLADLYGIPNAGDVGLVCTNVRMMDGKRPIFIDAIDSTFFFPYLHIRFVEIPATEMERYRASGGGVPGAELAGSETVDTDSRLPVVVPESDEPEPADAELDLDIDIDEDFLKRVRDI